MKRESKTRLQRLSPLLFTLFGFALLSFVTVRQFMEPRPLVMLIIQITAIVAYVVNMAFESRISIGEVENEESHEYDRNSMELAAVVKISLLFCCLGIGNTLISQQYYPWVGSVGIFISLIGYYTRGSSIIELGPDYGHRIRPIGKLVHDKGIYSVIRHGAYSGTFFIHMGVTLVFLNIASAVLLLAWLGVVILRIKLEENLLMQDNRYKEYAKKTKFRMIPAIW